MFFLSFFEFLFCRRNFSCASSPGLLRDDSDSKFLENISDSNVRRFMPLDCWRRCRRWCSRAVEEFVGKILSIFATAMAKIFSMSSCLHRRTAVVPPEPGRPSSPKTVHAILEGPTIKGRMRIAHQSVSICVGGASVWSAQKAVCGMWCRTSLKIIMKEGFAEKISLKSRWG